MYLPKKYVPVFSIYLIRPCKDKLMILPVFYNLETNTCIRNEIELDNEGPNACRESHNAFFHEATCQKICERGEIGLGSKGKGKGGGKGGGAKGGKGKGSRAKAGTSYGEGEGGEGGEGEGEIAMPQGEKEQEDAATVANKQYAHMQG